MISRTIHSKAEQKAYKARMRYQRLIEHDRQSAIRKIMKCERKAIRKEHATAERRKDR